MKDITIDFRETARIGFEWTFEWENQKYKWIKESKMKSALECRAIRKTGNICVAQYLPCTLKDEYFGIFTVLGYNMLRCNLSQPHQLELILIMSLMTLLDKSNDGEWKKDNVSIEEVITAPPLESTKATNEKKVQQKKQLNDHKLEMMLEKDARRSRKQMQMSEKRLPMSAGNSPSQSPKISPLPTPTTSASQMMMLSDFRLQHSQSSNLDFYGQPNKMPSNAHYMKPTTFIRPYEFGVNDKYFRTSSQKY
ncbi:hypothetical protein EDC96DRAFT_483512 [Choanephora cucurbitarum]|nr:hypothetical protein EDC96DRAFT_483512 [Choanephora cucurbitarum]